MLQTGNDRFHGKTDQPNDVFESYSYLDGKFIALMTSVHDRATGFDNFVYLHDVIEIIENVQVDINKRYLESTGQAPGSYKNVASWFVPDWYSSYGASSSYRQDVSHRHVEWHSSSSTGAQYALSHQQMPSSTRGEPRWHQGQWNQSANRQAQWWSAPKANPQWQPTPTWSQHYNQANNSTWDTSGYGPTINNRSNQQRYNRSNQVPYRVTRGDVREQYF